MNWELILKELGLLTIISGLITWLIKQLGQNLINKDLKTYELELNKKAELYKQELFLISQKASKLHDKRIDRIEELYYMLNDFHNDMQIIVSWKIVTGMTKEEVQQQELNNVKKAETSGNKFLIYYMRHKLYFNLETCKLIDEIINLLKESHADFTFKYIFGPTSAEMEYENIKNATNKIRVKVPEIKIKLEENFRKIIGVE
ncbi:hypothetical protein GOQ30_01155 [Flavobacterium sp. TP390]|uniref:Uncharacterized protein n=1 Tax=Flavobacterium profundi TaxID=1774945 RepID=A0A6I4IDY2_9FLAO|nr:hypothetical protein [Flavobacterium profundi]MVO07768.1 hypothetical protein [Flavobacterium profundi]